ncbi:MAG TPA: PIN domain-containing protein [Herpetosiphonaceae bacterium]
MSASNVSVVPVFIDTNIWLYAFNQSQDKQKHQLAKRLIRQTSRIVVSTQIVNEGSANLLRKFQASESDVRKIIRSFYRKYIVIELNRNVVLNASDLRGSYNLSFWDSMIVASAFAAGATILYSEDMQHGLVVQNQLSIVNPLKI